MSSSSQSEKWTANQLATLLAKKYKCMPGERLSEQYWMATEVSVSRANAYRRIDCVVMDIWGRFPQLHGFEIKVSASDLRNEFKDNSKHACFYDKLDYFSILCPREIVDKEIIPKNIGILCPSKNKQGLSWVRNPLNLNDRIDDTGTVSLAFVASFVRRLFVFEKSEKDAKDLERIRSEAYEKGATECREKMLKVDSHENKELRRQAEKFLQLAEASGVRDWQIGDGEFALMTKALRIAHSMDSAQFATDSIERTVKELSNLKTVIEEVLSPEKKEEVK